MLGFDVFTREAAHVFCLSYHDVNNLASPFLGFFGRKLPKQLSPCLIEYMSVLTPNDTVCLACLRLFYYSLNDSTVQKSRPLSEEVFPV